MVKARRLIVILGDQLSPAIASLKEADKTRDVVLMGEVLREAAHRNHHKKSIVFFFSAMRHFADELRRDGWRVDYASLDDGHKTFADLICAATERRRPQRIVIVEPGEWGVRNEIETLVEDLDAPIDMIEDDRFICNDAEFERWAKGRKGLRMEFFYREMRRKTGLLMEDGAPVGGRWNFDADNRKPAWSDAAFPEPRRVKPDKTTNEVIDLVNARFGDHFGEARPFWFAVTRKDAERERDHFMDKALAGFGRTQDAMLAGEKFLNHSVLSLYLNAGLLDPLDLCRRAEAAYRDGRAPLNAVEGFIRQIIGWREFVRAVYRREGPGYADRNALNAERPLPAFYWTGETQMACVAAAVRQTREEAYAHHIQRLMITGNFALIAGIDPAEIHDWYAAVYADALEWVEEPNTLGMSQFADGGLFASKPYAASGAYINRMSDYCASCSYNISKRTEEDACPFNALYWDFVHRNEKTLGDNARMARIFDMWSKMDAEKRSALLTRAAALKADLDSL